MPNNRNIECLPPGTVLKSKEREYTVVRVLGSGSFGITYLATSTINIGATQHVINFAIKEHFPSMSCFRGDDGCIVKAIPAAQADVDKSKVDFKKEADRLKKICKRSRNIVSVNETFEANGTAYYVMEYLDGGRPRKTSETDAINIVLQLAEALKTIHQEHVLHLDVKPDNIVMKSGDNGEIYPVLIDFGVSKHFTSGGRPTSRLSARGASDGYAPQEQYADIESFSPKYDVYALGAVLFYLLTGKTPPQAFKISPNQNELAALIPDDVSELTKNTILGAMKPSAFDRIPDMDTILNMLTSVSENQYLRVSRDDLHFGPDGGSATIQVEAGGKWKIDRYQAKWLKVAVSNESLEITVKKNESATTARECSLRLSMGSLSKTIDIYQEKRGTVVIKQKKNGEFWKKHANTVMKIGGGVMAVCMIVGGYFAVKPLLTAPTDQIPEEEVASNIDQDVAKTEPLVNPVPETEKSADEDKAEPENKEETAKEESDDQKFEKARSSNDYATLLSLANKGYIKAYYPVANYYYNSGDKRSAKIWAQKAVSVNVDKRLAQQLLDRIDPPVQEKTNDELFAEAKTLTDYQRLADKGYAKAYAPLANEYFKVRQYDNAHNYALKARDTHAGLSQARLVVDLLAKIGYYDNGANGGKPIF